MRRLTGGARAASIIEETPAAGDCKRPKNHKTTKAVCEIHHGTSSMMLVFTAPGSTALHQETYDKFFFTCFRLNNI